MAAYVMVLMPHGKATKIAAFGVPVASYVMFVEEERPWRMAWALA